MSESTLRRETALAWWRREWVVYAWSFVAGCVAAVIGLRLWNAKLSVPFEYQGDAIASAAHISTVLTQGWFEFEPRLGAPAGEFYYDFPQADNFTLIMAKVVGLFSHDWVVVFNVVFLLGFPLAALTATWFLRTVGVGRALAVALAVAYAIAPYHFQRGESHLYLGEYFPVPLAVVVLVWVLRGEALFTRRPGVHPVLAVLTGRGAAVVGITALLATASQYYSVFFLLLLAFAGVVALILRRDWRRFGGAVVAGAVVVVTMLINVAPNLIFQRTHGAALQALERSHGDTELYAFKLAQLVLPWSGHNIGILRRLRAAYDNGYPMISEHPALGGLAAAGLVAAFAVIAYLVLSRLRAGRGDDVVARPWFQNLIALSALTFFAFLLGSVGGISTFISFVTTVIRGWNRISIVMAIMCLGIIGLLIQRGLVWLANRRRAPHRSVAPAWVSLVAAVLIGCIALIDQTPYDASTSLKAAQTSFLGDRAYFASLQKAFPDDATILQLPYIRFPEDSSPNGTLASSELVPFLHTTGIKWTAGGIKGRPIADWPDELEGHSPAQIAALAAAAGMTGILVDRDAYNDGGRALVTGLQALPEVRAVGDESSRWVAFDLRPLASQLRGEVPPSLLDATRRAVIEPVTPYPVPDFQLTTTPKPNPRELWASNKPDSALTLENPRSGTVDGVFSFTVSTVPAVAGPVQLTLPDGSHQTVRLTGGTGSVRLRLSLAPGQSQLRVAIPASGQTVQLGLSNILFTEDATQRFLDRTASAVAK